MDRKLWMLHRLKGFGLAKNDLIEIYILFIRSRLEYCVPVWNSSLTQNDIELERIQKTMLKIVYGDDYIDALQHSKLTTCE